MLVFYKRHFSEHTNTSFYIKTMVFLLLQYVVW